MTKEDEFWSWFQTNANRFSDIYCHARASIEPLLDEILERLHEYCPKLFFQIGGNKEEHEIVISAAGNADYFSDVNNLTKAAPEMVNWKVIAFKPAMGIEFVTNYENIFVDPKKAWFIPLHNRSKKKDLGIKVYLSEYTEDERDNYLNGVYEMLDTFLGELFFSESIHYVDVAKLPPDPGEMGFIELKDLPEYIAYHYS